MNVQEWLERALEVLSLALIKTVAGRLLAKSKPEKRPGAIICVQVPPEISEGEGGTVEVHWVGAAKVPGLLSGEKEPQK